MSPRGRDEEAILRETMTALCRALGPGAMVMRNEANALTSFAIGLKSDLRDHPAAVRIVQERFQRTHPSTRYGLGVGSSDLIVVLGGRLIGLEMKAAHGSQSEPQRLWQAAIERAGGRYHLARSAGEAVELVSSVPQESR